MTTVSRFTFFDSVDADTTSGKLNVADGEALVLEVTGNFSGTLTVYGHVSDDTALSVINLADLSVASTITAAGVYTVPCVYGFDYVYIDADVTSGEITTIGKLCRS